MTTSFAYSSRCRTCGKEIAAGAPSCPHSGAANLEERCPHCGAVTTSSPDKELRYRCDLCGGPRLPRMDPALHGGKRAAPFLKRADEARKGRARYRAITAAFAVLGGGSSALLGLWGLVFGLSFALTVTWALFAGSALLMILWSLRQASAKTKEIAPAIDQAWTRAATDAAAAMKGPFTAAKLARTMGIDEALADEILTQLDASDVVRSDVTEAGEVAYQTKFRVGAVDGDADEAVREAEAVAEAEAGDPGRRALR